MWYVGHGVIIIPSNHECFTIAMIAVLASSCFTIAISIRNSGAFAGGFLNETGWWPPFL